jgi:hypothetical protein
MAYQEEHPRGCKDYGNNNRGESVVNDRGYRSRIAQGDAENDAQNGDSKENSSDCFQEDLFLISEPDRYLPFSLPPA